MADQTTTTSWWKELPLVLICPTPTSLDDLPQDVAINILSRLPVKKLVQFTCLSKNWYSLIKNPIFVRAHIDRSISQLAATTTDHHILVTHEGSTGGHMLSIFADNGDYDLCCKVKIPFPFLMRTVQIVGSCNGLVCLTNKVHGYGEEVFLFNPVIRKLKTLESDSYSLKCFDLEYSIYPVLGFGFCKRDKDFRVVRILYLRDPVFGEKVEPVVVVYSLKSAKWRRVVAKINHTVSRDCNACVDGCMYWVAAESANSRISWVVWFDLKDEVFHEVKMPENYDKDAGLNNLPVSIMRWNGEVAIGVIKPDGVCNHVKCSFWVLKKDHGWELLSKVKHEIVLEDPLRVIPVGFTWSGKTLICALHIKGWSRRKVNAELSRIVAVNVDEWKAKNLAVDGPHSVATCFEESLALFLD